MTLQETSIAERLIGIETALNWHKDNFTMEEINQFLLTPKDEFDFTYFDYPIKSKTELRKTISFVLEAIRNPDNPWAKIRCSCCGGDFELTRREVEWYQSTGYPLPTICPQCIDQLLRR